VSHLGQFSAGFLLRSGSVFGRRQHTGETLQTTDPGRALVTGKWKDVGRFKGPILRSVAARAPYFHNGSAPDLRAVVDFYDTRFGVGFTTAEKADLVAFLRIYP
jgi:cytochrome c peroxidase